LLLGTTARNNTPMSFVRLPALILVLLIASSISSALEGQPASDYRARRVALGNELHGGVAILFAAEEPVLDFDPYRQDSDFYYLTGWNQPGAALLIVGPVNEPEQPGQPARVREYKEILFLPTRNLRLEKYTGTKMDASTPDVSRATGVDSVEAMTSLADDLNKLVAEDRRLFTNVWTQPHTKAAESLLEYTAVTLGGPAPSAKDVTTLTTPLRELKDPDEIRLLKKASDASIAGQKEMMRSIKPGETERAVAGRMIAAWYKHGCERPAYAPIVGAGIDSTILHYSENSRTIEDGDVVVIDAACEYSMYASDITRTVPANGHFTPRQREIYDIVLGAQKAAIDAFVAGKSKLNDFSHRDPASLDLVAYNYINTHGKDLNGQPLGKYWLHGLGHMLGIDVHDPTVQYPAVLKPGMVFTIEPGIYIPEEKLGVRIECDFLVLPDGKLLDLNADLPHSADEVEAAMRK
jgi:Xaa-Pro aminopeptidase